MPALKPLNPPKRKRGYDPVLIDQRSRVARRTKAVEAQLRAEVQRLRGVVTVYDDLQIGQAATLYVQVEIAKGALSRGQTVDPEVLTRFSFGVARALRALGLRESILEPPSAPPDLRAYLGSKERGS